MAKKKKEEEIQDAAAEPSIVDTVVEAAAEVVETVAEAATSVVSAITAPAASARRPWSVSTGSDAALVSSHGTSEPRACQSWPRTRNWLGGPCTTA